MKKRADRLFLALMEKLADHPMSRDYADFVRANPGLAKQLEDRNTLKNEEKLVLVLCEALMGAFIAGNADLPRESYESVLLPVFATLAGSLKVHGCFDKEGAIVTADFLHNTANRNEESLAERLRKAGGE